MIQDFYHGNIIRSEHHCQNPEYQELAKKWLSLSSEFENTLNASQIEMFHELTDTQGRSSSIAAEDLYITGFKDGATMMLEILSSSN